MPIRISEEITKAGYYERHERENRVHPLGLTVDEAALFLGIPKRTIRSYRGPGIETIKLSPRRMSVRLTDEAILWFAGLLTDKSRRAWKVHPGFRSLVQGAEPHTSIFTYINENEDQKMRVTRTMVLRS